jgi:serine/threonine protein phosphatase PrpC
MPYLCFKAIAQGDSHREKGLPCQDAVFAAAEQRAGGLAIVADGHGSEKHFRSDTGSQIAVEVAQNAFWDFAKLQSKELKQDQDIDYMEKQLAQIERYIIVTWRQKVLEALAKNPLSEREIDVCREQEIDSANENDCVRLYGTTLIAAFVYRGGWFVLQIGDGKCVVIDDEGAPYFPPELEDERLAGGLTTSLCDSDAASHFRHDFGFDRILGLTVASDGVSDSFLPEEYLKLHRRLYTDFCADRRKAEKGLQDSIAVWSTKGSRDDVSMAGVLYKKGFFD